MSAQIPDAFASPFNPVDLDPNAFDLAEAFNSMFELMDGMPLLFRWLWMRSSRLSEGDRGRSPPSQGGRTTRAYLGGRGDRVPLLLVRSGWSE